MSFYQKAVRGPATVSLQPWAEFLQLHLVLQNSSAERMKWCFWECGLCKRRLQSHRVDPAIEKSAWQGCKQERSKHCCTTWVVRDHRGSWGRHATWSILCWEQLVAFVKRTSNCLCQGIKFPGKCRFHKYQPATNSHQSAMKCLTKTVTMTQEERAALLPDSKEFYSSGYQMHRPLSSQEAHLDPLTPIFTKFSSRLLTGILPFSPGVCEKADLLSFTDQIRQSCTSASGSQSYQGLGKGGRFGNRKGWHQSHKPLPPPTITKLAWGLSQLCCTLTSQAVTTSCKGRPVPPTVPKPKLEGQRVWATLALPQLLSHLTGNTD